jgi:hypothetical protein
VNKNSLAWLLLIFCFLSTEDLKSWFVNKKYQRLTGLFRINGCHIMFRGQSNKLLSSVIPGSVTDALDPANNHVIQCCPCRNQEVDSGSFASATLFMKRLLNSVCSYFYVCMRYTYML